MFLEGSSAQGTPTALIPKGKVKGKAGHYGGDFGVVRADCGPVGQKSVVTCPSLTYSSTLNVA